MSKLSIIVPVYYNADTIHLLYDDMKEKILDVIVDYELIFVDDGSEDASWNVMNQIRKMDERVCCVRLSKNYGEHAAILAGLSVCTGDCAVTKQADLQEDSELILQLYDKWKEGHKVVLAIRASRDESAMKKFLANRYYDLVRKVVDSNMPKGGCDCYLVDRQVIEMLKLMDEKNSSLTLQVLWTGFRAEKVYFHRKNREIGVSRWTLRKKLKLVIDSMISFTSVPMKFMSITGVAFFLFSLIGIVGVVVEKVTKGTPIVGYASLMSVILLSSGLILLMLGILGEYIWRILEESRERPPFIIDEIIRRNEANDETVSDNRV